MTNDLIREALLAARDALEGAGDADAARALRLIRTALIELEISEEVVDLFIDLN